MREKTVIRFSKDLAARVAAAQLGLIEGARQVYVAVTSIPTIHRALHAGSRHSAFDKARSKSCADASLLAQTGVQVVELAYAGAGRAELMPFVFYLQSVIDRVCPAPRSVDALDLRDVDTDVSEERLQGRRRVRGAGPDAMLEEVKALRDAAAVNLELALALEREVYGPAGVQRQLQLA